MTNRADPTRWGVSTGFHDVGGGWHEASQEAVSAVLHSMGADTGEPPPPLAVTVRTDHELPSLGSGVVDLEDGSQIEVGDGPLPVHLPTGYHHFSPNGKDPYPLIVSPGTVADPERRQWGFAVQLYAARSRRSWGIGDLADLARLSRWSRSLGATFAMVNPLHAPSPGARIEPSPYYPGSRSFRNPLYLAVDEVPGCGGIAEVAESAERAMRLNSDRRIDHNQVWEAKSKALEAIFAARDGYATDASLQAYIDHQGADLALYATFCALTERYGTAWREWPEHLQTPAGAYADESVKEADFARRVRFHSWLQWLLDDQLANAAADLGVVADLAVGVDPNGADAWLYRESFVENARVGAPPDEFNTLGQDWGLAPFDPWRLRSSGYRPWISALRATFGHAKGIRIDHIMGLWRLFWIPAGHSATDGLYVRYPHDDLLNILSLEAERAGAFVVGEDLGTVEEGVREELASRRILSYRLWWFEDTRTEAWPELSMGAVSTHDLPTVAGVLSGSDLEAQREIGARPNEESSARLLGRVREVAGTGEAVTAEAAIAAVYADLGRAPCRLLTATMDDLASVEERANMPGSTQDVWPNWSLALHLPLEELESVGLAGEIAASLNRP